MESQPQNPEFRNNREDFHPYVHLKEIEIFNNIRIYTINVLKIFNIRIYTIKALKF